MKLFRLASSLLAVSTVLVFGAAPVNAAAVSEVSPSSLSFGQQVLGTVSAPRDVTVSNTGSGDVTVNNVAVTPGAGTGAGEFTVVSGCTGVVVPGESCTIAVRFAPQGSTGPRSATIDIATNGSVTGHTVNVTGQAVAPVVSVQVTPTAHNFGNQELGTTATRFVDVTSTGNVSANVGPFNTSGDPAFAIASNTCGTSLAPNATCRVEVAFAPVTVGSKSATLNIGSSAGLRTVTLSGNGTGIASGTVDPQALVFGDQPEDSQSSTQQVTITGTGTVPLSIAGASVTGSDADDFTFDLSDCQAASLPSGGTCTIAVRFTPSERGERTALLSLISNSNEPLPAVSLSGAGTHARADLRMIASGPASAKRGAVLTYEFVVTNDGPSAVTGVTYGASLPNQLSLVSIGAAQGSCRNTPPYVCVIGELAPGASVDVTVVASAVKQGPGTITAVVGGLATDPNLANNHTSTAVTITNK